MKTKILGLIVALFTVSPVMAQVSGNASSTSTTASNSGAQASPYQNLALNSYTPDSQTIHSAPTVYTPSMAGSFSQGNCMMGVSGGFSLFWGVGGSGGTPVDGQHCDWRLNKQGVQATAASIENFANTAGIDAATKVALLKKAAALLDASADMDCLADDRQRAVLEKQGLCANVADLATLDHRFNQPRSTQIDYSGATQQAGN